MVTVAVICCAALLALVAVLYVVHRLRPEVFKVDATLTRWASFKIEMRAPHQQPSGPKPRQSRRRAR